MPSLNPFTRKREAQEQKVIEKIDAFQAQQELAAGDSATFAGSGSGDAFGSGQLPDLPETSYESEDLDKYLPASAGAGSAQAPPRVAYEPPSRARQCFGKLQSGFMIGASLGGAVGFLYGTYAAIRYKHILYLPIAVLQAGGGFGFFLACGTVIRCDEPRLEHADDRRFFRAATAPTVREPVRSAAGTSFAAGAAEPSVRARSAVVAAVCQPDGLD